MFDNDQITDSPDLRELRDSLSGVAMPERPPLEAITAKGRAHRRQRRARVTRLFVGGVIAATAITVGLIEALSPPPTLVTIRTAAYTLRHNQNGTDTLTLSPGELFDPARLQSDLTKYGIPAKVTTGSYCTSNPAPAGFTQVVSGPGPGTRQAGSNQAPAITIDPSQMPSGTELSVGHFQLPTGEQQAEMALINTNSYACTGTPPTLGPGTPGLGVLYGGHTAS